jgi:hypothetical protein
MDSTTGLGERSDTAIDNIVIAEPLSKEDIVLKAIHIYPNPVKSSIHINSPKTLIQNVTIYDMGGRIVSEIDSSESQYVQLDASALEAAMYFVKISTADGFIIKQVIKY